MGRRHEDGGTWRSGEQGDGTQVLRTQPLGSQGTDPGVAVTGVGVGKFCPKDITALQWKNINCGRKPCIIAILGSHLFFFPANGSREECGINELFTPVLVPMLENIVVAHVQHQVKNRIVNI